MHARLFADGVDGIITARVTRMREILEERQLVFRSRLEPTAASARALPGFVDVPLYCRDSAVNPHCRASLALELTGLAGRALAGGSGLVGAGTAEVARGETAPARLRLSPWASFLLFFFGPLETRLHVTGTGLNDADATQPLRLEAGFPTRAGRRAGRRRRRADPELAA